MLLVLGKGSIELLGLVYKGAGCMVKGLGS